jgi:tetratricopeptide (TPR) repeat protein
MARFGQGAALEAEGLLRRARVILNHDTAPASEDNTQSLMRSAEASKKKGQLGDSIYFYSQTCGGAVPTGKLPGAATASCLEQLATLYEQQGQAALARYYRWIPTLRFEVGTTASIKAHRTAPPATATTPAPDPTTGQGWTRRCLDAGSDHAKTIHDCRMAIIFMTFASQGERAQVYRTRARAFRLRDEYVPALEDLKVALTIEPGNALALNERGLVYEAQSNYAAAISDYDAALKITPRDAQILANRGYAHEGAGNQSRAKDDYDQSISLKPNLTAMLGRARIYVARGEHDAAVRAYTEAMALNSRNHGAVVERGLIYLTLRQDEKARADIAAAVALDATCPTAVYAKGILALRDGDGGAGARDVIAAVMMDPYIANSLAKRGLTPPSSASR